MTPKWQLLLVLLSLIEHEESQNEKTFQILDYSNKFKEKLIFLSYLSSCKEKYSMYTMISIFPRIEDATFSLLKQILKICIQG